MKELQYPFDAAYLLKKKKYLKRKLKEQKNAVLKKKIAILGGSTTDDVRQMLELFLLNYGIEAEFYESGYNQYYQDAMFPNDELIHFAPDLIYIHTSNRNIKAYPQLSDTEEEVAVKLQSTVEEYITVWEQLTQDYHCPIIQNNMELPDYRLMGNRDASDYRGRIRFISNINEQFYLYAQSHHNFYINDIHYLSASYGLERWTDPFSWYMYKYALNIQAIPYLAYNLANIIKAIYGRNKKAFVLDMDNTLWGGVIGDDGVERIEIGQESALGQAYAEFQEYIKQHKELGIVLNIASKNEMENALSGLKHPSSVLRKEDFICIKANWEPKSNNIAEIAEDLNILPDGIVFVDDNPAERELVRMQMPGIAVPEISTVENYIREIDRQGYFEVTNLSEDDRGRNRMYQENARRNEAKREFQDYREYLLSLKMQGEIRPFEKLYFSRITQLINKSNQFNLTTRRFTQNEIEEIASHDKYITLYGRLSDKFGDNGIVSVVIGQKKENVCHIIEWLMSCRVLKRDMEMAMMDGLVERCRQEGIDKVRGYYYPTAKNKMVKNFYYEMGFEKIAEDAEGNSQWQLTVKDYNRKNKVICIKENEEHVER